MEDLYEYCTKTNVHTKRLINELFLEMYKNAEKLLKVIKQNNQKVLFAEFPPSAYVNRLWGVLNSICLVNCNIFEVWEVFDKITTNISKRLNGQLDLTVGMPPDCAVYFGINHLQEGILIVGNRKDIVLNIAPIFQTEGIKSLRA